jgi:tetratricopeptide (TPR) repeat protein
LGTGLGNFSYAYPRYASLERLPFLQHNPYLEHPHNEYLGLAAEVGLPGLAVFIGLLLLGAVAARRALKARDDRLGEITGLAGAGIAGAVNALFFYTWHSPAGIIFWIVLGLLWALGQRPSDLPPRFPAQRGRSARLAVAGLAVAGIAIATFFFGIRPSVSSHFGQRARTDWYGLRGTEALEGFRRAFAWESENYLVPFEAGMGFFRANMFPQAAEAFAEAARLHPTHLAARNNLGLSLARLGDIPGARRAYQEALRINPEYAVARNNLANILLAENDLSGAIAEYRRALRSYPEYAEAWYNLGVALAQTGQTAEGITAFRRAAEIDPKMTEATSRAEELAAHLVGGRNLGAPKL